MQLLHVDYLINDSLRPLGGQVGALSREIWLCDIWLAGIHYTRLSDCEILVEDRDLTKLMLFYTDPTITLTVDACSVNT